MNGNSYEFVETAEDTNEKRVTLKATIKSKGELVKITFAFFRRNVLRLLQENPSTLIMHRIPNHVGTG